MWRSSEYWWTHDISTAGTHSMPSSSAVARASGTPATPSWSVSAIVVDPGLGGRADDVGGLELAVGDGGVRLQVDHRRGELTGRNS